MPCAELLTFTEAPGITDPVWSFTVPELLPFTAANEIA
jgi:hypothetical protein